MKHFSLLLTFLLIFAASNCKKPDYNNQELSLNSSTNFYNIVVLLDLSSRLSTPNQINRDIDAINMLLDLFEKRQQKLLFTNSKDKFTVVYQTSNSQNSNNLNQSLQINMAGLNKPKFDALREEISLSIKNIYSTVENITKEPIDYWTFFRDQIGAYLEQGNPRITFKNKCFILSDGYFIPQNAEKRPKGTCFNKVQLNQLRSSKDEWERVLIKENISLLPHKNLQFGNLEVMMLEVMPKLIHENIFESEILKRIWTDWFTKMGIDFKLKIASDKESTKKAVVNFLSKKNLWTSMKAPIKLIGDNYSCQLIEHEEIVNNHPGKYFLINLQHAETKQKLEFPLGKYYLPDFKSYEEALAEFGEKVIRVIQKNEGEYNYRIFVKGQADRLGHETFKSWLSKDYNYNEICFYPQYNTTYTFQPNLVCEKIKEPFGNRDLPNLRAKFLHQKMGSYFSHFFSPIEIKGKGLTQLIEGPVILDGEVTFKISDTDRNAMLFLFLPDNFFQA